MLNIAVCDDNTAMLQRIKKAIVSVMKAQSIEYRVNIFSNGDSVLQQNSIEPFDILFLDIEMPDTDGFEVAKQLRDSFSNSYLIFITTHSELVYNSFDFQPFNFIRKTDIIPIEMKIDEIMTKLLVHTKQNDKVILEDKMSEKCSVFIRDIIYLESSGHYCKFYIRDKERPIKQRGTIPEFLEMYKNYNFIQIHRGYIINMRYLDEMNINKNTAKMRNVVSPLPLGRKYKEEADHLYTLYLRTTI